MSYTDDIVLLSGSERGTKQLLRTNASYLKGKLTVNRKKSKVIKRI